MNHSNSSNPYVSNSQVQSDLAWERQCAIRRIRDHSPLDGDLELAAGYDGDEDDPDETSL